MNPPGQGSSRPRTQLRPPPEPLTVSVPSPPELPFTASKTDRGEKPLCSLSWLYLYHLPEASPGITQRLPAFPRLHQPRRRLSSHEDLLSEEPSLPGCLSKIRICENIMKRSSFLLFPHTKRSADPCPLPQSGRGHPGKLCTADLWFLTARKGGVTHRHLGK